VPQARPTLLPIGVKPWVGRASSTSCRRTTGGRRDPATRFWLWTRALWCWSSRPSGSPRDWSDLPLVRLLLEAAAGDDRERIAMGPPVESERDDVELVWTELRVVDAGERRESRARLCLARGRGLQCLLTFDFWPEDAGRLTPVWEGVLRSLRLDLQLEDPTRGRRLE
jgi:hypothetical protein